MKIEQARRVVLKIGSALLTHPQTGELKQDWLQNLVEQVSTYADHNQQDWLIVSSGAVGLGRSSLNLSVQDASVQLTLEQKQAAASIGQLRLAEAYTQAFSSQAKICGQILLSPRDTENRRTHLNARNTIKTLLKNGIIPVINENDTVATDELRFGDNDRLAARVAQMVEADLLILLSTTDGVYDKDPGADQNARHIPEIKLITKEIMNYAGKTRSAISTGGMISKLEAADIATQAGCRVIIMDGRRQRPLDQTGRRTFFHAPSSPEQARKRWIRAHIHPKGIINIDKGAREALMQGNSLLPVGVLEISGNFERGDAVDIKDQDNRLIARGLIAYDSFSTKQITGVHSDRIAEILGYEGRKELVHRNDLVLMDQKKSQI